MDKGVCLSDLKLATKNPNSIICRQVSQPKMLAVAKSAVFMVILSVLLFMCPSNYNNALTFHILGSPVCV